MRPASAAKERARSRRPITDEEVPYLEALGSELERTREMLGLSRAAIAELALIRANTVAWIEAGARRTRRSTLQRIVDAMSTLIEEDEQHVLDGLVDHLVELGGPAVAAESPHQARMLRRAKRRQRLKNLALLREARDQ